MSVIIEKLHSSAVISLGRLLQKVLDKQSDVLQIRHGRDAIFEAFIDGINRAFDQLGQPIVKTQTTVDFDSLSLMAPEQLDHMVMLEGMIANARNLHISHFISFNTRLNALFSDQQIDESSNPLDPQQITNIFSEAIVKQQLAHQNSTDLFRNFNDLLLKHLDKIILEANKVLIDNDVIPNLGLDSGKTKARSSRQAPRHTSSSNSAASETSGFGMVEEVPFDDEFVDLLADNNLSESDISPHRPTNAPSQPELFSLMQNLLRPSEIAGHEQAYKEKQQGSEFSLGIPDVLSDANFTRPVPSQLQNSSNNSTELSVNVNQQFAVPKALIENHNASLIAQYQPADNEKIQMVDQSQLIHILNSIQEKLDAEGRFNREHALATEEKIDSTTNNSQLDISESLGDVLKATQAEGVISAFDHHSSDVINLVTLLYDAIWRDDSVPIPIKELIGRTQITIIKVALTDTSFFDREDHPARILLNDFAEAGIGWTAVDDLRSDPLYCEIERLVEQFQRTYEGDEAIFESLTDSFKEFRNAETVKERQLEQNILRAKARKERIDDINELVSQKISERILGITLTPVIDELLHVHFHKFMVLLVIKEGPGSNAWRQSINTIDVLLWTVQDHVEQSDRERMEKVKARLHNNLRKALRITQLESSTITKLLEDVSHIQEASFSAPEVETIFASAEASETTGEASSAEVEPRDLSQVHLNKTLEFTHPDLTQSLIESQIEKEMLPIDHIAFTQIDELQIGTWLEFDGGDTETSVRCKLAAKITAIDKFIFVNRHGVKVVEKTRQGLAEELAENTVNIISDGMLFSRAMEAVIGNLRETQQQQQTGSAYHPTELAANDTGSDASHNSELTLQDELQLI